MAELEQGRWLQVVARGDVETIGTTTAPWFQVRDPWAPLGNGPLAGPWEGWIWGGLLGPLPAGLPELTPALWDRVLVADEAEPGRPSMWALRPAADEPGVVEIGEWSDPSPTPGLIRRQEGLAGIDAVHRLDPGNGRTWLWITGTGLVGETTGQLVPTGCQLPSLVVTLDAETVLGRRERTRLYLVDLDADGVQEAILHGTEEDAASVVRRSYSFLRLGADGRIDGPEGVEVRDGLLPPPDLAVRSVTIDVAASPATVFLTLANDGSRSDPTRLEIRVAGSGTSASAPLLSILDLPSLAPAEERRITVPVVVPRTSGRRFLVEVLVVPTGVESSLDNNRLARWTDE